MTPSCLTGWRALPRSKDADPDESDVWWGQSLKAIGRQNWIVKRELTCRVFSVVVGCMMELVWSRKAWERSDDVIARRWMWPLRHWRHIPKNFLTFSLLRRKRSDDPIRSHTYSISTLQIQQRVWLTIIYFPTGPWDCLREWPVWTLGKNTIRANLRIKGQIYLTGQVKIF